MHHSAHIEPDWAKKSIKLLASRKLLLHAGSADSSAEYLAEKIFDQEICSPFRDGQCRNNPHEQTLCGADKALTCGCLLLRNKAPEDGRTMMRKTILTILGTALLAASTVQIAAAAERHKARRVDRAPAPVSEPFRNANDAYGWAAPSVQPGWSRYQSGGISAPAGH
jgi:hypothetical protein